MKNIKETFFQSVLALMISQVIIKGLSLIYRLYLTNKIGFGDAGNAIVSGSFQIYSLVISITAIGIPGALAKLVAERLSRGDHKGANKIFKLTLMIFSVIGIIGSYLLIVLSSSIAENYIHIKETKLSIIALAPSIFIVSVISVFKGYFSGREQLKKTAKAQSIDQVIKTIITIVMIEISCIISKNPNTEIMAACASFAITIGNLSELLYLIKEYIYIYPEIQEEIKNSINSEKLGIKLIIKKVFSIAVPISLTALITAIAKNLDSTSIINNLKDVIGYEEAKKQYGILSGKVDGLINVPLSFNMAISTALLPSIAANNRNNSILSDRTNKAIMIGMITSIPIAGMMSFYANLILETLFPNATSGAEILKISSISIIFITMEQIANMVLHGIGKSNVPIISIAVGVIVKAILNACLVHHNEWILGGANGAAFSNVMCHVIASSISYIFLLKNTKIRIKYKNIIIPVLASGVMIIISKIILNISNTNLNYKLSAIIAMISGIIAYLIILKIFGFFDEIIIKKLGKSKKNKKKEGFCHFLQNKKVVDSD